jgi:hypothetical protein
MRKVGVKDQRCAGVHARNASRRLACRHRFPPRAGGGNATIINRIARVVHGPTIPRPFRSIRGTSGMKVMPDRILLCFHPVESDSPEAIPFSACPYHLAVQYEMTGIPDSIEPKFEVVNEIRSGRSLYGF